MEVKEENNEEKGLLNYGYLSVLPNEIKNIIFNFSEPIKYDDKFYDNVRKCLSPYAKCPNSDRIYNTTLAIYPYISKFIMNFNDMTCIAKITIDTLAGLSFEIEWPNNADISTKKFKILHITRINQFYFVHLDAKGKYVYFEPTIKELIIKVFYKKVCDRVANFE